MPPNGSVIHLRRRCLGRCAIGRHHDPPGVRPAHRGRCDRLLSQGGPGHQAGLQPPIRSRVLNYAHPDGWQAVVRTNDEHALIVIHTFGGELPRRVELPIPEGYNLIASFAGANAHQLRNGVFEYHPNENFEGAAYLLGRDAREREHV